MSRGKELAKNTAIIAIGKISTQFISFFLLPLYTAILSTEEYGTVDVFNTSVSLLLPIMTLQVEQGAFRFLVDVRDEKEKQKQMITSVTAFILLQCIVCFIAFFIISPIINIDNKIYILLNMIANSWSLSFLQFSRGLGSNTVYSLGSFLTALSTILLNVVFIVGLRMGAEGMLLATFLGNIVCCIFLFFRLKLYTYISISCFEKEVFKKILKYSLPLVPNSISWWLINASDRFIVAAYLGLDSNGILSVAHKFPSVYAAIYNIVNMTWIESATMYINKDDGEEYLNNMLNLLIKLFTSAFLGVVVLMPFVFPIFVNDVYDRAYELIPIYMLASVSNALVTLMGVIYTVNLATKEIAKSTMLAGFINVITHIILIRFIGIYAASISSAISYLVIVIYRYIDGQKYYHFRFDFKFLFSAIILYVFDCCCYYSNKIVLYIVALFITVVYVLYMNRSVLLNIKDFINSFKSRRRSK